MIAHVLINIKKIVFFTILLFMLKNNANARFENEWKLLDRESGCSSLSALYEEHPYLEKEKTPQKIFSKFRLKYTDVKIISLLEVLENERIETQEPATKKELDFFKFFTKKNALVISSLEGRFEFILISNELCKKIIP